MFKITIFRLIRLMKKERPTDISCSAKHDFAYVLPQLIMKSTNFSPFWRIRREKHWKISNWNSLILPPSSVMAVSKLLKIKQFLWALLRRIKWKPTNEFKRCQISCHIFLKWIYYYWITQMTSFDQLHDFNMKLRLIWIQHKGTYDIHCIYRSFTYIHSLIWNKHPAF